MSSTTSRSEGSLDLLRRICLAGSLAEALSMLVEAVLIATGRERALVLTERDGELCGVVGIGWGQNAVSSVCTSADDLSHPLVRALAAGLPVVVEEEWEELGMRGFAVLPIAPGAAEHPPLGVLIVEAPAEEADLDVIAEQVELMVPALLRLAELDELRRSSGQLERQRELLTTVLNALPDPVLITDLQNSILLENRRARTLFTAGDADSEGRRRAVEINNLLFSSFLTRSTIGGADTAGRELNLVDPFEGEDLLFEVLSTPLPDSVLGEGATVSVLRDVTDLKRAATELEHQFKRMRQTELKSRRERDRLNLILEHVSDPIVVTDEESNIILMNREAERLFEVPSGTELRSRRRQDVRANDTKFSSFISDFSLSADQVCAAEFHLVDPESSREFPVEVVSGKILNERAEMTAIVSILHDLTKAVENERLAAELAHLNEGLEDRVRAATAELEERNRQLEWQSRELERAYRLKSQFLASMSHELRTPINALLGYTSLMRDQIYGELTTRQEEALDRMYSASQHLLELVNDILDLAKIEAGKMPVHIERVNIVYLIRELSLTIEPMVRPKDLEYRVQVEPDLPILETDATKVRQILLNLLSNAVKFTRKGYVAVHARPGEVGTGVEIAVTDTGIGIKEEDLGKIFEDFRQVDQSSTREYGGTGLGLSITKKLLHLLGGHIRVDSTPGVGSTFTVWLPLRSGEVTGESKAARSGR
ncbi:MAG TPA: ATP-binding protein, partial [Longimicrobiaceae bacterium]|nr:ATP-binding protein [Longimicrobiaceae bacterium]